VADSFKYGDEVAGSSATELVDYRRGKKWPKPISRYFPSVCIEVEANPGQDKQLELPEYETGMLPT
jgi:hypothetical protein